MKKRTAFYLLASVVIGVVALIAFDRYSTQPAEPPAIEAAKECDSCSLRHQSFARSKEALKALLRNSDDQLQSPAAPSEQQ